MWGDRTTHFRYVELCVQVHSCDPDIWKAEAEARLRQRTQQGQREGSVWKGVCHQPWQSEFDPWNLNCVRKDSSCTSRCLFSAVNHPFGFPIYMFEHEAHTRPFCYSGGCCCLSVSHRCVRTHSFVASFSKLIFRHPTVLSFLVGRPFI